MKTLLELAAHALLPPKEFNMTTRYIVMRKDYLNEYYAGEYSDLQKAKELAQEECLSHDPRDSFVVLQVITTFTPVTRAEEE